MPQSTELERIAEHKLYELRNLFNRLPFFDPLEIETYRNCFKELDALITSRPEYSQERLDYLALAAKYSLHGAGITGEIPGLPLKWVVFLRKSDVEFGERFKPIWEATRGMTLSNNHEYLFDNWDKALLIEKEALSCDVPFSNSSGNASYYWYIHYKSLITKYPEIAPQWLLNFEKELDEAKAHVDTTTKPA